MQGFGAIVAEHLHTHTVVSQQPHISRNAVVVGKEHVVALVHLKLLVAKHGVDTAERHSYTVLLHVCFHTKSHTKTVAIVVDACAEEERLLIECATEKGVEHVLLVVAVVAYLSIEERLRRVRTDVDAYCIELYACSHERVDAHLAVDALHGRRVHIDISIAELVAETSSSAREDVLLAGIEVDRKVGQAFAQTQLVNVSFIALLLSLYVHLIKVVEYVLH